MPAGCQLGAMSSRRRFLAAATTGAVAATSGCIGFLLGEESQTFEATAATVDAAVASQTGYESLGTTEQRLSQTFEVGGEERTVELANKLTEYHRTVGVSGRGDVEAAVFATLATPKVELLGETLNPIGHLGTADLARQVQGQYDSFRVGERVAEATVQALGAPRTLGRFEGRATLEGTGVDVSIHLSNFTHGGDVVVPLGLYPRRLSTEERAVLDLAAALAHG